MSFGSSTPGGSPEGIGGNESGIGSGGGEGGYRGLGIGNPRSYTSSYSQEAMASALAFAQSVSEGKAQDTEYGLSVDPNRDSEGVGQLMDAYTTNRPEIADVVALQNRENDWKTLNSAERQRAKNAAEQVGMNTDYMGSANKETAWEKILNSLGSIGGGIAGGIFGPPGSIAGNYLGGKLGTHIAGVRDDEEIQRAAGLLGPVTSPNMEREPEGNSLANRIIWPLRKGLRG